MPYHVGYRKTGSWFPELSDNDSKRQDPWKTLSLSVPGVHLVRVQYVSFSRCCVLGMLLQGDRTQATMCISLLQGNNHRSISISVMILLVVCLHGVPLLSVKLNLLCIQIDSHRKRIGAFSYMKIEVKPFFTSLPFLRQHTSHFFASTS